MTEVYKNILNEVPLEYKYLLKHKIIVLPINVFYQKYDVEKNKLLNKIHHSKNDEINTLHKYSCENPIDSKTCQEINEVLFFFLREFLEIWNKKCPKYYSGFGIVYDTYSQKTLKLHKDDSFYTINMCLESTAEGNEVVFVCGDKEIPVNIKEDHMIIHLGNHAHFTNEITSGKRTNVVLWYK